MKLSDYFEKTTGYGVLATADGTGKVGVAVYSRPHFIEEDIVAYIMTDRQIHNNLETNPHAAYIFIESGEKYKGKRLYLTKVMEETDPETINRIRRRTPPETKGDLKSEKRFLVSFKINKVLPLVGEKE
jgi:hypothetical protein